MRNPKVRAALCSRFRKGEWFEGVDTELGEGEVDKVIKLVNSRLGLLDKLISLFHRKNRKPF